ncbi:MAG TPA: MaoC family dehydratase [Bryobacteraceae bacterium]|jgi:acyl dehydratase|nr:MaoC family dehydratase [Bryobacteraceae bacterium]
MALVIAENLDKLRELAGREIGVSDWFAVTQERINTFADATGDHQWIHVDPERARRESPYKTTIAHGFLTLSLISHFIKEVLEMRGLRMAINYGLNRVRFPSAVLADSKVRARVTLQSVRDVTDGVEVTYQVTIESEGSDKPNCVAEWIARYYPA